MRIKNRLFIAIMALLLGFAAVAQQKKSFPQNWVGNWKGKMQWYQGTNPPREFDMQLRIHPVADSVNMYTWQIIYGKEEKDNRPYYLKAVDTAKGHWVVDEVNGIVLDQYFLGNKFCGAFTVMGNTIVNNYWMEKDQLMVEFISYPAKPVATTGKGTEEIPNVDSYRIGSYQKGALKRVKKTTLK
jgi:hypothetical protein